jgi:signal transduction histidine kinase
VLGAADIAERGSAPSQATVNAIVLLFLGGAVVGYVVRLARDAQARLARSVEIEAATRERERLARRIHDDVLQVLALVARRGVEIGGPAAELGRQAAEQELALRALVASAPIDALTGDAVDVRRLLAAHASRAVTVSAPADPVPLPAYVAHELAAAVAAALHNVSTHAGEGAQAWVLVEDDGANVVVSVRDDGAGMVPERIVEAAAAGRLGIAQSIRGRIEALGGTVHVTTAPGQGTEVELQVSRPASA